MKSFFFLLIPLLSILNRAGASSADPQPTDANYEAEIKAQKQNNPPKVCHIYQTTYQMPDGSVVSVPFKSDNSINECKAQCPPSDANKSASLVCSYVGKPEWTNNATMGPGVQSALALCTCDSKLMDVITDDFMKALAAIGDIACELWVATLTGIVDFIIDTNIDTVASASSALQAMGGITDTHKDLTQSALKFHAATNDVNSAKDCFGKWVASKICPAGALSQDQTNSIFDTIYQINQLVVAAATLPAGGEGLDAFVLSGAGRATGDGADVFGAIPKMKPPPKDPPNPIKPKPKDKPSDEPSKKTTDKQTTQPAEKTTSKPNVTTRESAKESAKSTEPTSKSNGSESKTSESASKSSESSASKSSTTSSSASACSKAPGSNAKENGGKRDRDPVNEQQQCGDPTITRVVGSVSVLSTSTYTCVVASAGQACAHAYSAIKNYGAASKFTCGDSWINRRKSVKNTATRDYKTQHRDKTWTAFTKSTYDYAAGFGNGKRAEPDCQADEWPPAYWLPDKTSPDASLTQWGQRIRLLPALQNGAAGNPSNQFCAKYDGGNGNQQRGNGVNVLESNQSDDGMQLHPSLVTKSKAQASRTISEVNNGKTTTIEYYTNVPFQRAVLEWEFDNKVALQANDWMLRDNPCWPQDLVPDDPGYVLLTDDKYYQTANRAFVQSMNWVPQGARANARQGIYNYPPDQARLAAARARRPDITNVKKRSEFSDDSLHLIVDEGKLMIRDTYLNETRSLTEEEHDRLEMEPCVDRECSQDEEEDDEHAVFIPGSLPSAPAANSAIPTHLTRAKREEAKPSSSVLTALITPAP